MNTITVTFLDKKNEQQVKYPGIIRVLISCENFNGHRAAAWRIEFADGRVSHLQKNKHDVIRIEPDN